MPILKNSPPHKHDEIVIVQYSQFFAQKRLCLIQISDRIFASSFTGEVTSGDCDQDTCLIGLARAASPNGLALFFFFVSHPKIKNTMYKIEFYGNNGLPVVSASIHIFKWKANWNPKYTFRKGDYTERSGLRRVMFLLYFEDEYTATVFYKLIKQGCRQYYTRADVYLVQTELGERIAEYHDMGKEEESL